MLAFNYGDLCFCLRIFRLQKRLETVVTFWPAERLEMPH